MNNIEAARGEQGAADLDGASEAGLWGPLALRYINMRDSLMGVRTRSPVLEGNNTRHKHTYTQTIKHHPFMARQKWFLFYMAEILMSPSWVYLGGEHIFSKRKKESERESARARERERIGYEYRWIYNKERWRIEDDKDWWTWRSKNRSTFYSVLSPYIPVVLHGGRRGTEGWWRWRLNFRSLWIRGWLLRDRLLCSHNCFVPTTVLFKSCSRTYVYAARRHFFECTAMNKPVHSGPPAHTADVGPHRGCQGSPISITPASSRNNVIKQWGMSAGWTLLKCIFLFSKKRF